MNSNKTDIQELIALDLKVSPDFSAEKETQKRIAFLKNYLQSTGSKTFILGISGGVDSTVAGRLAQLSVEQLRQEGYPAKFISLRLPYGEQLDEDDAQDALNFIQADKVFTVNIKQACDISIQSLLDSSFSFHSEVQKDFILGNIKARQRMLIQYALAGAQQGLVIGTDHAAEAVMGFFTKYGDGACDIAPLNGLTKRRVKKIAAYLNAPQKLIDKKPMADLENFCPQKGDEDVFGISYSEIDDFLEGKQVSDFVFDKVRTTYFNTEHKRALPVIPD